MMAAIGIANAPGAARQCIPNHAETAAAMVG
jgi:hypothetical protein